jgi:FdhD protein
MMHPSINRRPIQKVQDTDRWEAEDDIAVEEPLEIRLRYGQKGSEIEQAISITMRTPGNDPELALGFLFTEGILTGAAAIRHIQASDQSVTVSLAPEVKPDITRLQRHFYTSSSCGVCGKSSIDALRSVCPSLPKAQWTIDSETLYSLPQQLRHQQAIFQATGGLHAAALFHNKGEFITLREDIGRHNALDKLTGHLLQTDKLPATEHILLLSGRACYELIQKAAMAGISFIAAVSAPSSLAIQTAEAYGITLVGFLRDNRFNVYTDSQRLLNINTPVHA